LVKGKMKAQVFYEPEVMKLEEIDIPQIADDEVLVKVKTVGICGSDISYYYGHSPLDTPDGKGPLILGHEFSGEIVEVGKIPQSLGLFTPGDRVTCNPVQQCNSCENCSEGKFNVCSNVATPGVSANGAFAEYCKMRYTHVYKIPDDMSYEMASIIEPMACATYAVNKLDVKPGDFVVVFGPGPIGIMMVQLIKASGAGKVALVGRSDYKLGIGKEVGADYVLNVLQKDSPNYVDDVAKEISRLTGGRMADRVIVPTSAKKAMQEAIDVSGTWATIVYFGLPGPDDKIEVPALNSIQSDITIKFSWLAPLVWPETIRALGAGLVNLDKIVTHRFSLDELEEAIKFMKSSPDDKLKGVVVVDK
jgi:threonine dehydrogenase-like Zn-dependent dehydrogenase